MPGYIANFLLKFKHGDPLNVQSSPYTAPLKLYGKGAQDPIPDDTSKNIDKSRINIMLQVIGEVLYYAKAVDNIVLVARSAITREQSISTVATEGRVLQLLDYLTDKPSARVRFHTSDIALPSILIPPICQKQEQEAE